MKELKGIICAGGSGERLDPLTQVTNKHLLPVYHKPMITYPLKTLVDSGIDEVTLVTSGSFSGGFLQLLGDGFDYGLSRLQYAYQRKLKGGIADAVKSGQHFCRNANVVVILGDNVFEDTFKKEVEQFKNVEFGARIFLKRVKKPERFGVAEIENNKIVSIEEKPKNPKSDLAVTGIYLYDSRIFDVINTLKPSNRGELEITDVNNFYLKNESLEYTILEGFWSDCGTIQSLYSATSHIERGFRC